MIFAELGKFPNARRPVIRSITWDKMCETLAIYVLVGSVVMGISGVPIYEFRPLVVPIPCIEGLIAHRQQLNSFDDSYKQRNERPAEHEVKNTQTRPL
jgi:hypothetical protein